MRCVVTGAAGFVGSSIVDALLAQGHEVVGIDCFVDYYPRAIKEQNLKQALDFRAYRFVELNMLDDGFSQLLDGAEVVFHQAAQAGVRASWGAEFSVYTDNNILATQRLLELCRQEPLRSSLKKVVYASSSSVYGDSETLPTHEGLRPQPISPYGVSKLAAEHLMVLYATEFGVPTVSLRYFTVYGPRQRPDMGFHRFIKAALRGSPIKVFGDGEQTRDFTFIEDIVSANLAAALQGKSGLVANIGGGSRVTVNEVLTIIENIVGKSLVIERIERQSGDVRHTGADTSRAEKVLAYRPTVSLEKGLQAEAQWIAEGLKSGLLTW